MGEPLSNRPTTNTRTNGKVVINMPNGIGGYKTKLIPVDDLLAGIGTQPLTIVDQIGNFNITIPAKYMATEIYVIIYSGTPTITIGTTLFGDEILAATLMTGDLDIEQKIKAVTDTIIYFSVTGGNVSVQIDIKPLPIAI